MTGLLVPETCCPAAADGVVGTELPAQPVLQEPGCCERIVVTNAKAPAVAPDGAEQLPAGPVAVVTARVPAPLTVAAPWRQGDQLPRPPGRSAPVFLLTHAFLI